MSITTQRKISLLQATAINMTDMVGIGPFIVLSLIAERMGHAFLYAWFAGALLSFIDAMVWSQLGAAFPLAGGSYNFLKESYGGKVGKLMSFLFVWQTMLQAPLVMASAAVGFSQYFDYFIPLSEVGHKFLCAGVIITVVILLYRNIESIGKISLLLCAGVLITMGWIIIGGMMQGHIMQPLLHINDGLKIDSAFGAALGFSCVKSMYSYLGYYNVCHLGGDIQSPQRNIPKSMFISIACIATLYILMNMSIASVLPLQTIQQSKFVVSEFISTIANTTAARVVTGLVLWVAFASLFSATLGYSRIPYAAAADGAFFKVFAKLHPTKNFPYISLLVLASFAIVFSMTLPIKKIIPAILAMRILVQFIGQSIGLIALTKRKGIHFFPWKMPLYPIPIILAIIMWGYIFYSTEWMMMSYGIGVLFVGMMVYYIKEKLV